MQLPEIQNYVEYLFRIALKKCGNINDAEDLTQDVLLAAQKIQIIAKIKLKCDVRLLILRINTER